MNDELECFGGGIVGTLIFLITFVFIEGFGVELVPRKSRFRKYIDNTIGKVPEFFYFRIK